MNIASETKDDFKNQLIYIGDNPARKQYGDYPHVHTKYLDRIDSIPNHLLRDKETS